MDQMLINNNSDLNLTSTIDVNYFFAIFLPPLAIITIILNSLTIFAFWKSDKLREKPSELLILSLSCADLLTGLLVIPLWSPVYMTPEHWPWGHIGCRIAISALDLAIHGSLFAVLCISTDRFMLISMDYPQYLRTQTKRIIKLIIGICWSVSITTVIIEMGYWDKGDEILRQDDAEIDFTKYCLSPPRRLPPFSLSFFVILYLIPVTTVCTLSILFLYRLHKRLQKAEERRSQANRFTPMNASTSSNTAEQNNESPASQIQMRYVKPAVTLMALVTAMAVCMLPYCLYVIITDILFVCPTCQHVKTLYNLLLLQFCNACLDPFLYAMTNSKIRNFYKKLYKSVCKRSTYA